MYSYYSTSLSERIVHPFQVRPKKSLFINHEKHHPRKIQRIQPKSFTWINNPELECDRLEITAERN